MTQLSLADLTPTRPAAQRPVPVASGLPGAVDRRDALATIHSLSAALRALDLYSVLEDATMLDRCALALASHPFAALSLLRSCSAWDWKISQHAGSPGSLTTQRRAEGARLTACAYAIAARAVSRSLRGQSRPVPPSRMRALETTGRIGEYVAAWDHGEIPNPHWPGLPSHGAWVSVERRTRDFYALAEIGFPDEHRTYSVARKVCRSADEGIAFGDWWADVAVGMLGVGT